MPTAFDRELQPDDVSVPAGSTRLAIMLLLGVALFFGLIGGGTIVIVYLVFLKGVENPTAIVETNADRTARLQEVLGPTAPPPASDAHPDREAIERFFAELDDDPSEERQRSLIDNDRVFLEMQRSGYLPELRRFELNNVKSGASSIPAAPLNGLGHEVVDIRKEGELTVVTVLVAGRYDTGSPIRYWLVKSLGDWKLVDWEEVDFGLRESAIAAILTGDLSGKFSEFYRKMESTRSEYFSDYDQAKAETGLRAAEDLLSSVPAAAKDHCLCWVASMWNRTGFADEAQRVARTVTDPDRYPAAYYHRSVAHFARQEQDEARTALREYVRVVGWSPHVLEQAVLLDQLAKDRAAETEHQRRLVQLWPHSDYEMQRYISLANPADTSVVTQILHRVSEVELRSPPSAEARPDDGFRRAVVHLVDDLEIEALTELSRELSQFPLQAPAITGPELLAKLAELKGDELEAQRQYGEALQAAMKRLPAGLTADDETAAAFDVRRLQASYIDVSMRLGDFSAAYHNSADKNAAIERLLFADYHHQPQLDEAAIESLRGELENSDASGVSASWYRGWLLEIAGKRERAIETYRSALMQVDPDRYFLSSQAVDDRLGLMDPTEDQAQQAMERNEWKVPLSVERMRFLLGPDEYLAALNRLHEALPNHRGVTTRLIQEQIDRNDVFEVDRLCEKEYVAASREQDWYRVSSLVPLWLISGRKFGLHKKVYETPSDRPELEELVIQDLYYNHSPEVINQYLRESGTSDDPAGNPARIQAVVGQESKWGSALVIVELLERFDDEELTDEEYDVYPEDLRVQQFRALMKTHRESAAAEFAAQRFQVEKNDDWRFREAVARNDAESLLDLYRNGKLMNLTPDVLWTESECRPLLFADETRPIREAFPLSLPALNSPEHRLVYAQGATSLAQLEQALRAEFQSNFKFTPLRGNAERGAIVELSEHRYLLSLHELDSRLRDRSWACADPELEQRLSEPLTAVQVTALDPGDPTYRRYSVESKALEIVLACIQKQETQLLYYEDLQRSRIFDPADVVLLKHRRDEAQMLGVPRSIPGSGYEIRDSFAESATCTRVRFSLHEWLPQLRASFDAVSDSRRVIKAQLRIGSDAVGERLWVKVNRVEPTGWGASNYVGHLLEASELFPEFKTGEPVKFGSYVVVDWRFADDPQQTMRQRLSGP